MAMRLVLALIVAFGAALAHAQSQYPAKPVRLIIPFPPGGSNDVVGRVVAAQLGERLGQGVVIDNRGGGGGTIGVNAAAKSPADGYTLLFVSVGFPVSIALASCRRNRCNGSCRWRRSAPARACSSCRRQCR